MAREIRLRFAQHLRDLRKRYGWTQEQLAERADLAYRHVQRLESLKSPPPAKIDTLGKLAQAFNLSPAKLLTFGSLTGPRREWAYLAADAKRRPVAAKALRAERSAGTGGVPAKAKALRAERRGLTPGASGIP